MVEIIEDRMAARFSRGVARSPLLQRLLRTASGSASSLAGPFSTRRLCTFHVGTWGKYCAATPSCGTGKCTYSDLYAADRCAGGAARRCNYWTTSPYCWCSLSGCYNGRRGYFSCCDCWKYGNYGTCRSGNTACICKGFVFLGGC